MRELRIRPLAEEYLSTREVRGLARRISISQSLTFKAEVIDAVRRD